MLHRLHLREPKTSYKSLVYIQENSGRTAPTAKKTSMSDDDRFGKKNETQT